VCHGRREHIFWVHRQFTANNSPRTIHRKKNHRKGDSPQGNSPQRQFTAEAIHRKAIQAVNCLCGELFAVNLLCGKLPYFKKKCGELFAVNCPAVNCPAVNCLR
jgi:hypothetical protein